MSSSEQRKFGHDKHDTLTAPCREREVWRFSLVAAPKDRFVLWRGADPGRIIFVRDWSCCSRAPGQR
jgi:uncharacterized protein